jgi:hypothetical protein
MVSSLEEDVWRNPSWPGREKEEPVHAGLSGAKTPSSRSFGIGWHAIRVPWSRQRFWPSVTILCAVDGHKSSHQSTNW